MRPTLPQLPPIPGLGQDERLRPEVGKAGKIVNMRWDPSISGWASDRGWEPLLGRDTEYEFPPDYLAPTRFLSIWTRHAGAEVYYLYERNGSLCYDWGNDNDGTEGQVVLADGRHIPGPADAGTQLIPFGRFALLMNGFDEPLKFFGGTVLTPFGWSAPPPPPTIAGVDPDILGGGIDDATGEGISQGTTAIGGILAGVIGVTGLLGLPVGENAYSYRFSFVSETGSESPMSPEVLVSWSNGDIVANPLQIGTYAVWISDLPRGGDHCVARRIYRTKNLGSQDGLTDRAYYFVAEVPDNCTSSYVDVLADSRLVLAAPDPQASSSLPPGLRFGAAFDGRLWLGGGSHSPTRIWYSEKGLPEQFGAFSYYDLGAGPAGDITQIVSHEGALYVFRERGLDLIRVTDQLEYQLTTLSGTRGTTASNTIKVVPGVGLVFLARDGVYAASQAGVRLLSAALSDEFRRVGAGSLARATATYSDRELEYWVQYPADGASENTRGAVLHLGASTPDSPAWSLRHVPPSDGSSEWRTIVTCLATDPDGWIIMGTSPINLTNGDYPGTQTLASLDLDDELEGLGLQVWSARPAAGTRLTVTVLGEGIETTREDAEPIEAIYQSPWIEYDPRALVHQIEVWALNTGRPNLTVEIATNGREEWTDVSQDVEMSPREGAKTSDNDHVYAPEATAARFLYEGKWGTSKWREDRIVRVRWDVALANRSVSSFCFRIRTQDYFGIIGWRVNANGTQIGTQSQVGATGGA